MATETTEKNGKRIHYAWWVMIGYGMLMCATIGTITVLGSFLFFPVCDELGFDLSTFTLYVTLSMIFMAIGMPICGKILANGKIKLSVLLTVATLMEVIPFACMSMFDQLWMWFAAAVPIGLGLSATSTATAAPTLGNWFHKKTGFAIGMIFTMQSIWVAAVSPLFSNVVESMGWRTSYIILAVAAAVLALPFTIFVIRYRPEEKGLQPYGYDPAAQDEGAAAMDANSGVPFKTAVRSLPFVMIVCVIMLCMTTSCMNTLFPSYAEVVGLGGVVGGLMVTAASLFDIFLNPVVGATSDKLGATKSMVIWTAVTMFSFVLLYFSGDSPVLACLGAGINDAMYVICGVGFATYAMELFGMKDYERIFSVVMMIGYLISSFGMPLMMFIYESTGVFQNVFLVCFILDIVIILFAIIGQRASKRLPRVNGTEAAPADEA